MTLPRRSSRTLTFWVVIGSIMGGLATGAAGQQAAPGGRENLARDKQATASSIQDDSKYAGSAFDGELESRWCAADGSLPQWLQVDLGRPESLTGCRIVWEAADIPYTYQVLGSPDAQTWTVLVDATPPGSREQVRSHPLTASGVRYVRLNITATGAGQWASLYEFEVFGTKPAPAVAARPAGATDPKSVLKDIKVPPGFEATVFAAPPDVHYPTCLAAAPTGEVFVGVDENGSLDARADRGRVVRCVDVDHDGRADRFNVFAAMDSPRGLVWDAGTLYVLHPPFLSAFRDTDGDGVSDKTDVLVRGIGFDLKQRGADHTTNGIRLAIDGFLYIAVGDYGFVQAQGTDGGPLQLLGGGVVRVRTDGTGLEIVSRGQRNIYDVAIDPYLNLFTRDNTNDGDGWDVRLSHVVPTGNYGYPSMFKRFGAEILQPLADYGGGSPCGSLFLQEPGLPAGYGNTLYTCEWGRGAVFMHPLTPQGASFRAGQETFVTIPRPTDIDVDGSGRITISSWRDGGFTYSKANVGYVIQVKATGAQPPAFPDLARATSEELVRGIGSDSSVLRLAAQRELLRRPDVGRAAELLRTAVTDQQAGLAGRVAALFTLAQKFRPAEIDLAANDFLLEQARVAPELRETAIRALADRRPTDNIDPRVWHAIDEAVTDPNPRVRVAAAVAAGRLKLQTTASGLLKLTADGDPVVAHVAVQALVGMKAREACVIALADPTRSAGAARALQAMHDPAVVADLIAVAQGSRGDSAREPALMALCRLYCTEAPYEAGNWWGTRPDTSGPYYKGITWSASPQIGSALQAALLKADPIVSRRLLNEMIRTKLDFDDSTALAVKLSGDDPALRESVVGLMVGRPRLTPEAIGFLAATATDAKVGEPLRARAIRGLLRHQNQAEAREAAIQSLAAVDPEGVPPADVLGVWTDFAREGRHLRDLASFAKLAEGDDARRGTLGYAVLAAAATNEKAPDPARAEASAALGRGWSNPAWTPRLLRAVGLAKVASLGPKVEPFLSNERSEIRQAAEFAAKRLNLAARIDPQLATGPKPKAVSPIAATAYDAVLAAVIADPGDPALGTQLFERQGCVNCHAVAKAGPIKGPYLGDVAARYNRAELVESILKPSARIAQGFETQKIATADGRTVEGFVVREANDEVELRNSAGNVVLIPKRDIEERGKGELSVMPQGLMDPLTPHDLASLIAYFESIRGK